MDASRSALPRQNAEQGSVMSVIALIDEIAAGQHGAVHRRQLRAAGATDEAIDCAVESGELVRVRPAVYASAGAPRTWCQQLMAAVLDAGPGACASHRAAAILLGIARRGATQEVEISVPRGRSSRLDGVVVHSPLDLTEDHVMVVDGIPCTGPLRTLADLGAVEPWWQVRDAWNDLCRPSS